MHRWQSPGGAGAYTDCELSPGKNAKNIPATSHSLAMNSNSPPNEAARVAALRSYDILDTLPEEEFDDLVRLAAHICGTPISLLSLLDDQRQWFKAKVGMDVSETPKDVAFCAHAIEGRELFVVSDASKDPRFAANPLVQGDPNIRFYAGAPLVTRDGHALGTLCVIDREPRQLDARSREALRTLSNLAVTQLELRRSSSRLRAELEHRLRLEANLQQAVAYQKAIFDSAAYAILVVAPGGLILSTNLAARRLLGYSGEELVGKIVRHLLHEPEELAAAAGQLSRELGVTITPDEAVLAKARAGIADERVWTWRRKDGSRVRVRLSLTQLRNPDGSASGYLGVASDITLQLRAEQELREAHRLLEARVQERTAALAQSEERLTLALGASGASIWDCDAETGRIYLSEGWSALLGGPAEPTDTTLAALMDVVHPDDLPHAVELSKDALRGSIPGYTVEQRVRTRAGEWKWIASSGKVVERQADGTALRMIGTNRDISAAKEAALRLAESEERFRTLTGISSDWYWEQDGQYRTTMMSSGDQAGQGTLSAPGARRWDTPALNLGAADWARHRAQLDARQPFRDFLIQRRDAHGRVRSHSVSGVPVFDASGAFTGYRGIGRDITDEEETRARIAHMAHYDALTGLPNRALLKDRIGQAIAQAQRRQSRAAVLFVDLDDFKRINDSLGHQTGDAALKIVSERLAQCISAGDTLGRLGGDEFLIILPELRERAAAAPVAERLIAALGAIISCEGHDLLLGVSAGISVYPDDGADVQTLMRNADIAMYRAKQMSRGAYQFYAPHMGGVATARLALEAQLRQGLESAEFVLHYQPKIDLSSGRIGGAEALLRWQPAGRDLVHPAQFISVLEDTGQILAVGEWALNEACRQTRAWQLAGAADMSVAVNVSARQLRQANFLMLVERALADSGLAAPSLELEITESVILEQTEEAVAVLERCRALGVRLALDDFGTGYSSLAHVKRFAVDVIKIDQSFVRDMEQNRPSVALIGAIITLAHGLGLDVVAEGVETAAQAARLTEMGCDIAQGYHFSRPLTAAQYGAFLGGALPGP